MAVATMSSHASALSSSLGGGSQDFALSDSAWERVVALLQELISTIDRQFDALLVQDHSTAQTLVSCIVTSFQREQICRDVDLVRAAGDGDLLDDIALSLTLASLRSQAIPKFWACIPRESSCPDLSTGWQRQLRCAANALLQLHTAHTSLLSCLRQSQESVSNPSDLYVASFRVAMQESWPRSFASDLQNFFGRSWQETANQARRRRRESRERKGSVDRGLEVEEWWCASTQSSPAPCSPADKVLLLLNPARRPQLVVASNGGDAAMVDGSASTELDDQEPWQPDSSWAAGENAEEGVSAESSDEDDDLSPMSSDDLASDLREVSLALQAMGLQSVWRDYVMRFTAEKVASTVQARCSSEYDKKGLLHQLTSWLYDPVLHWLRTAFGLSAIAAKHLPSVGDDVTAKNGLEAEDAWWMSARRVVLQFFEIFVEVRILEAFDMVRDFPDSIPALLDLRRCLARTGRTAPLVKALRQQLTRRLLIAGAHTRDVIKVYIKTIKAMRLVDPRGLLLDAVSAPIRAYLKHRKDTVRCIVTALTEDSDLQLELHTGAEAVRQATSAPPPPAPSAPLRAAAPSTGTNAANQATTGPNAQQQTPATGNPPPNNAGVQPPPNNAGAPQPPRPPERPPPQIENPSLSFGNADNEASEEEEDPDSWMPDPIDADPWQPSRQRRAQDVISLLVGIYGSKEMFIKEYKEMLADRLLGSNSYETEKETMNLELLKTRFGEAALGHCEVMLQDMKDSKRINGNIQNNTKGQATVGGCGCSAPFQPPPRSNTPAAPTAANSEEPLSRPFMAPFSLSGIFGLCLQPQGGQPVQGTASPEQQDLAFQPPSDSIPMQVQDNKMSVEQMQALVLSRHFWPSAFAKEDYPNFKLPPILEDALAEYSRVYAQIRAKRSLSWQRAHGLVDITVQLADRSLANVVVTPVHLAVLACFQSDTNDERGPSQNEGGSVSSSSAQNSASGPPASQRLSLQEVASRLELPEALVRKRISFWVSKGVLREVSAGVYDVQESLSSVEGVGARGGSHLDDDIEHSPGNATTRAGQAGGRDTVCTAELEACEAFAQAMLTQYTSLPLGRIHNCLQMFMMDPPYTQTESQLREFLTRLCQEGKLEFNGSNYALVKKS